MLEPIFFGSTTFSRYYSAQLFVLIVSESDPDKYCHAGQNAPVELGIKT